MNWSWKFNDHVTCKRAIPRQLTYFSAGATVRLDLSAHGSALFNFLFASVLLPACLSASLSTFLWVCYLPIIQYGSCQSFSWNNFLVVKNIQSDWLAFRVPNHRCFEANVRLSLLAESEQQWPPWAWRCQVWLPLLVTCSKFIYRP